MRSELLDRVSADILFIPPLIFRAVRKNITRTTLSEVDVNITPHHFEILRLLDEEGTMHPSEIGERLQIPKAQMTKLIDRLVALKIVERKLDPDDRRTYDITVTEESRTMLEEHRQKLVFAVHGFLSTLSDGELENLSQSLRSLRDLLLKSTDVGCLRR